jgi:hypothetical protein
MHCYQALETAATNIIRRNPAWLNTLPIPPSDAVLSPPEKLIVITRTICNDRPDTIASDLLARRLADIARTDTDAMTLLLAAMSRRLRNRFRTNASDEYHTDGLAFLAILMLDATLERPRVVGRMVNRAHNHLWKAAKREYQRGTVHPSPSTPARPRRSAGGTTSGATSMTSPNKPSATPTSPTSPVRYSKQSQTEPCHQARGSTTATTTSPTNSSTPGGPPATESGPTAPSPSSNHSSTNTSSSMPHNPPATQRRRYA